MDTSFVRDEPITDDLDLHCGNLNFVFDTCFHYAYHCVKFD